MQQWQMFRRICLEVEMPPYFNALSFYVGKRIRACDHPAPSAGYAAWVNILKQKSPTFLLSCSIIFQHIVNRGCLRGEGSGDLGL